MTASDNSVSSRISALREKLASCKGKMECGLNDFSARRAVFDELPSGSLRAALAGVRSSMENSSVDDIAPQATGFAANVGKKSSSVS